MRTPLLKDGLDRRLGAIAQYLDTLQELDAALAVYRAHVALSSDHERRTLADDMLQDLRAIRLQHLRASGAQYLQSLFVAIDSGWEGNA